MVFIIGYLLPWYLLLGEEVAHNLLGGRDPSLVDGLGSTALPTSVLLLGEEVTHNLLGGRDPSLVSGLAQYGPPNINTVFWLFWRLRLRLDKPYEMVASSVGESWAPGYSQCHAVQGTAMAYSNAILTSERFYAEYF